MADKVIHLTSAAITTIGTCNLSCKHCYSTSSPAIKNFLTVSEIQNYIDILLDFGIEQVFLGGGEPFLHPEIANIVRHAISRNLLVSISTNGHFINSTILAELSEAGLTHQISVSLDGPDEPTNKKIRGKNSFTQTLHGMFELNNYSKIVWGVNFVANRYNLGTALATALLAKRMGARYFNLIKFTPLGRGKYYRDELQISREKFFNEVRIVKGHFNCFGDFYQDIYIFDLVGDMGGMASSFFNDKRFENIPSGISITHDKDIFLTPASIFLGNCQEEEFHNLVTKIHSLEVQDLYRMWLNDEIQGVHQPVKK